MADHLPTDTTATGLRRARSPYEPGSKLRTRSFRDRPRCPFDVDAVVQRQLASTDMRRSGVLVRRLSQRCPESGRPCWRASRARMRMSRLRCAPARATRALSNLGAETPQDMNLTVVACGRQSEDWQDGQATGPEHTGAT